MSEPHVIEQPEARPVVACSDLLACPWCRGEASATGVIRYSKSHEAWWQDGTQIREAYFVNCMKCGVTNQGLCGHQTPQAAITHWNTRKQANDRTEPRERKP
jgi:hypothetical protein